MAAHAHDDSVVTVTALLAPVASALSAAGEILNVHSGGGAAWLTLI
jgi:hypothetical protein